MDGTTLVFGTGWVGRQLAERISGAVLTGVDIACEDGVADELERRDPARVVNCAGRTGRPNVDALEADPTGTYRSNVAGPIVLASACRERGIHFTHMGSGCLYSGDNGGAGFSEDDPPNFFGSLYARTKVISEAALRDLGALQFRLRLPISEVPGERNLLTKLLGFRKVIRVPNSITVLDDAWNPALALMERAETGVWNLVNPGIETHDRLLALYREHVDPSLAFDVVDGAALAELVGRRSNCVLSTAKLDAAGLGMPPLDERLPALVAAYGRRVAAATAGGGSA